jgi:hypothetical protein
MDSAHDVRDHDVLGMRQPRAPLGQRVITNDGHKGDDIAIAIATATADRGGGGNRSLNVVRGGRVVLSLAIPFAFITGAVATGTGPFGVNVPDAAVGTLVALALVIAVSTAALRG